MELVHCIQSLPADADVWFNVWHAWRWLMHQCCLLRAFCQAQVVANTRELVHAVLHGGFRGSVEGRVIGKQGFINGVCRNLGFYLEPLEIVD